MRVTCSSCPTPMAPSMPRCRHRSMNTWRICCGHWPNCTACYARVGGLFSLHTDWDSLVWHTSDRELHRRITAAWDEHLVHPHLPKVLARLMRTAGFTVTAQRVHVLFNTELTDNSFSAFDMRAVAQYVPGQIIG